MTAEAKLKKRGFVMTGGGAKGLYEAGVIHAFHITGMEFDIITGSSIGAMNSVFFGEYLFQKKQLPDMVKMDPATAVEAMDPLVKAYQHAWLQMPGKKLIDDSAQGPLGRLKDDLQAFNISLPLVTRLGWWWTDPDKSAAPPAAAWPALLKLMQELIKHLGGAGTLLNIFRNNRSALLSTVARTYLAKFGMDRSLVPAADDHKLKDVFTQPVSPLRPEHLSGDANTPDDPSVKRYILVDPARSLGDYDRQGIAVRVTRANYRTGRLEISAHVTLDVFVNFMEKQAWRLEAEGPDKLPLGSFRLQVPGNPNAVNAGLASGRFPGVFAPFPIDELYPAGDPENDLLHKLLDKWLADPEVAEKVKQIIQERPARKGKGEHYWEDLFTGWQKSESMRDFFPRSRDVYVDGGSIDNTPSNSAVDYVREWADNTHHSRRGVSLELFVIFLETEPKVDQEKVQDPAMFQVVKRTLAIQGAATRASDTNTVSTINTFGQRGEDLANALATVLESYRGLVDGLDEVTKAQV